MKPWVLSKDIFDFDGFLLENVEVGAKDFYRQSALESGESFVDGIFGGLGVVKDDTRIGFEFFLDVLDELLLSNGWSLFSRTRRRRASSQRKTRN